MSEQDYSKSSIKKDKHGKSGAVIQQKAKELVLNHAPQLRRKISLYILLALLLGLFLRFIRRLIGASEDNDSKKEAGVGAKKHHLADDPRSQISPSIQVEGMLIADFGYWSTLQNQIRNDMTNIFYIFLVLATIFAAGLVAAANLYFNLRQANDQFSQYTVEALIAVILIAGGILSRYFLKRTIYLSQEYMKCGKNLDDISKYYNDPIISDKF